MLADFSYLSLICLLGLFSTMPLVDRKDHAILYFSALPIGLVLNTLLFVFLVLIGGYQFIFLPSVLISIALFSWSAWRTKYFVFSDIFKLGGLLLVIVALSSFFARYDPMMFSGDTAIFLFRSFEMSNGQYSVAQLMREFAARGPLEFAAYAPSALFEAIYFPALGPACGISTVLSLGWLVYRAAALKGCIHPMRWLWSLLAMTGLATTYIFLQYSAAIHSAGPSAFYMFASVACAWIYVTSGIRGFAWLCGLMAIGAMLSRVENGLFIVAFLGLFAFSKPLDRPRRLAMLTVPLLSLAIWLGLLAILQLTARGIFFDTLLASSLITLSASLAVLTVATLPDRLIVRRILHFFPAVMLFGSGAILIAGSYLFPDFVGRGADSVWQNLSTKTWAGGTLILLATWIMALVDNDYNDSPLANGSLVVLCAVLVIPISFSAWGFTWEVNIWDSSNRILLSLLPIGIFYIAVKLAGLNRPKTYEVAPDGKFRAGLFAACATILVLQINFPPLAHYLGRNAFWDDPMGVANMSGLRQALFATELPAISPYLDFGWNVLGDTDFVQGYANPIHWLVLFFDPLTVIVIRTLVFFLLGVFGSFILIRHLTGRTWLSLFAGIIFCAMPVHFMLLYGTNMLSFIYCVPLLLWFVHYVLEMPNSQRLLGFSVYCTFSTSSAGAFGLAAFPAVIGFYAFFVARRGARWSLIAPLAAVTILTGVWALATAWYIVPFVYNVLQNRLFMDDLYQVGFPSLKESVSAFQVASILPNLAIAHLFKPHDAMSFYLPVVYFTVSVVGMKVFGLIFRDRDLAPASFLALSVVCGMLVIETLVFAFFPSLAETGAGLLRIQVKLLSYPFVLTSLVCVGYIMNRSYQNVHEGLKLAVRLIALALFVTFAIDAWLFVSSDVVAGNAGQVWANYGSPISSVENPNPIKSRWLEGMWPILALENLILAVMAMIVTGSERTKQRSLATYLAASAAVVGVLLYAPLQLDFRFQNASSLHSRLDYHAVSYRDPRNCIAHLVDRNDPQFRTLYASKAIVGPSGRNWKSIVEAEPNGLDQQKALFSYRNTTHPTTPLILAGFHTDVSYSHWLNVWPPTAEGVRNNLDLVRRIGAKWIVSAEPIEEPPGEASAKPALTLVGDDFNFARVIENVGSLAEKTIRVEVLARTRTQAKFAIQVADGGSVTGSQPHNGGYRWQLLAVDHRIAPGTKQLTIRVVQAANVSESDEIDLAMVRVFADDVELPVSLTDFSDWTPGRPLPAGWRFDGGADRVRIEKRDDGITFKGQCSSPSGPGLQEHQYEHGTIFVYELNDSLGIAFFGDRYKRLDRLEILRRVAINYWNGRTVLVEDEPPLSEPEMRRPPGEARVTADGFNRITVAAKTDTARPLVLTMTHRPFWSATIDDVETPIMRAYGGFMSVLVPAGEHVIAFKYVPWDGYVGLLLTLATLAGFGALAGLSAARRRTATHPSSAATAATMKS